MVSAGGAAAIVLNQTLQLFQQFESAGQNAYNKTVGAAINYADQLKKVSDITSISTDDLQRLRAAGLATGVSFDSIATAARMMTQKIGDAGAAGDELRASLAKIGVQVYDTNGKFKDTNDIFWETLKGLNGMSDAQERNRLALQTLGRSWYELAPMIRDYDIAAAAAAAKDPIDQAKIDRAHDFGVKLEIINAKFTAINRTVGDDTIPILDSFLGVLDRAT